MSFIEELNRLKEAGKINYNSFIRLKNRFDTLSRKKKDIIDENAPEILANDKEIFKHFELSIDFNDNSKKSTKKDTDEIKNNLNTEISDSDELNQSQIKELGILKRVNFYLKDFFDKFPIISNILGWSIAIIFNIIYISGFSISINYFFPEIDGITGYAKDFDSLDSLVIVSAFVFFVLSGYLIMVKLNFRYNKIIKGILIAVNIILLTLGLFFEEYWNYRIERDKVFEVEKDSESQLNKGLNEFFDLNQPPSSPNSFIG